MPVRVLLIAGLLAVLSISVIACGDSETAATLSESQDLTTAAAAGASTVTGEPSAENPAPPQLQGTILFNKISFEGLEPGQAARHSTWAINPNGGEPWPVTFKIETDAKRAEANMSTGCGRVLVADLTRTMGDQRPVQIEVMDFDGGNRTSFVPPGSGRMTAPSWSPQTDMMVYTRQSEATADGSGGSNTEIIHIVDVNGQLIRSFPCTRRVVGNIRWSPDGSRLAFAAEENASDIGRTRDIYVIGADGQNLVNVTHNITVNDDTMPGWSATTGIAETEAMYARVEELISTGNLIDRPEEPDWSPDSQSLLYIADNFGTREIWTVDLATLTHSRVWSPDPSWKNSSLEKAAWSPDGTAITFSNSSDEPEQMLLEHAADIWLVGADGTNPRLLYRGPDEDSLLAWMRCDAFPPVIGQP